MKYWSRQSDINNEKLKLLQDNTLSYGTRSNEYIKKSINGIIEIVIDKCIENANYGNSKTEISIEEIEEKYKTKDIRMLHSIIKKTPNRLMRHIKQYMDSAGFETKWLKDKILIRWCEDIEINDQCTIETITDDSEDSM